MLRHRLAPMVYVVWLSLLLAGCQGTVVDLDRPDSSSVTTVTDDVVYTEKRAVCADRNSLRNLYFGDLHVHTRRSFDAVAYDVRTTPDEAYLFAKGEEVRLPPLDDQGQGTRPVRLARPLDFVALTDHQEFIGEIALCTDRDSTLFDTGFCQGYRSGGEHAAVMLGVELTNIPAKRISQLCGDGAVCLEAARAVWQDIVKVANRHYDTSASCQFTSFVAYEYTSSAPHLSNNHRNVIFRNSNVPILPPSFYESPTEQDLWTELADSCLDTTTGCDALAIPHNSNWSNGNMFTPDYLEESPVVQREAATWRATMEPLLEIVQHKGDQEARNGFPGIKLDPLADFEKIHGPNFDDCKNQTGSMGVAGAGCVSTLDFARNVLKNGLAEYGRIGANPTPFGFIGSTDTHNGTPGMVDEWAFEGHVGLADDTPAKRLGPGTDTHNVKTYNPGGLAGVWAVENSRDALFDALRRKEVFATSGPRISVRLFGGFDMDGQICGRDDKVAVGYRRGVPMGGTLPPSFNPGKPPILAVFAHKDEGVPGHPGTPLQRIQIIKGWVDWAGQTHEQIFEVAGHPDNHASVDLETCEPKGDGFPELCTTWTDPAFDPGLPVFYYARVVENPTCSWRARDCNRFEANDPARPLDCDLETTQLVHQERAVTSPIFYYPHRFASDR